ncbi:MAG: phage tail protein [Myxococcales bacterium FL481]|nr:MAG: phage tail protein [Myxococcales bacterium FL481]
MTDPFLSEIRLFAGDYAPRGWVLCDGQLLPVSQYAAVFALLGTTYGGDGRINFGVPDLRGRVPIGSGASPSLGMSFFTGELGGFEAVPLSTAQLPAHQHTPTSSAGAKLFASTEQADEHIPTGGSLLAQGYFERASQHLIENYVPAGSSTESVALGGVAGQASLNVSDSGTGLPHNNVQPSLGLNYIMAVDGIFPPRN